jgi:hypothetical protein
MTGASGWSAPLAPDMHKIDVRRARRSLACRGAATLSRADPFRARLRSRGLSKCGSGHARDRWRGGARRSQATSLRDRIGGGHARAVAERVAFRFEEPRREGQREGRRVSRSRMDGRGRVETCTGCRHRALATTPRVGDTETARRRGKLEVAMRWAPRRCAALSDPTALSCSTRAPGRCAALPGAPGSGQIGASATTAAVCSRFPLARPYSLRRGRWPRPLERRSRTPAQ